MKNVMQKSPSSGLLRRNRYTHFQATMNDLAWQLCHNKTLRTSGRGGKGHFVGGVKHGWNRKGRW